MQTNKLKCDNIYWNLIELVTQYDKINKSTLIAELAETSRCDKYYNFEKLRNHIKQKMGKKTYNRIINTNYSNNLEQLEKEQD